MKKSILLAVFTIACMALAQAQTGGPPPPLNCPPNSCTTQYTFINLSADCDYELCLYWDDVTADYYAACPLNFPGGFFPHLIACVSLP